MMLRYNEPGWEEIVVPDGRRGLWVKRTLSPEWKGPPEGHRVITCVELCAGREGDDDYLKLDSGQALTSRELSILYGIMETIQWSVEIQACEDHCDTCPRTHFLKQFSAMERGRMYVNRVLHKYGLDKICNWKREISELYNDLFVYDE